MAEARNLPGRYRWRAIQPFCVQRADCAALMALAEGGVGAAAELILRIVARHWSVTAASMAYTAMSEIGTELGGLPVAIAIRI